MAAHQVIEQDVCHGTGKVRYATEQLALAALERQRAKGLSVSQAYPCRWGCEGWHLTHEGLPPQRRAR